MILENDVVSRIIGTKNTLNEFTGVGSVAGATTDSPMVVGVPSAANRKHRDDVLKAVQKRLKKRKHRRISEDEIPDDAKEISTAEAHSSLVYGKTASVEDSDLDSERPYGPLKTSVALVAPNCTPDWDVALSPEALPAEKAQDHAEPLEPEPSTEESPEPERDSNNPSVDALSVLLGGRGRTQPEALPAKAPQASTKNIGESLLFSRDPNPPTKLEESAPPTVPLTALAPAPGFSGLGGGASLHAAQPSPVAKAAGQGNYWAFNYGQ